MRTDFLRCHHWFEVTPWLRALAFLLISCACAQAGLSLEDRRKLPAVGAHPSGVAYWTGPAFANALAGGEWIEYIPEEWGVPLIITDNPQFSPLGYPKYLNDGKRLRSPIWPLHTEYSNRPASWPKPPPLALGRWLLTWKGRADIRLIGGSQQTGTVKDGRRIYDFSGRAPSGWIEIHAIDPADPITEIRVWPPDPADPRNSTLENHLLHPSFLAGMSEHDWGFIRLMDWGEINGSPQMNWRDRRPPSHCFARGVLNRRNPAPGSVFYLEDGDPTKPVGASSDRSTGVAWEHMIELCNKTGHDLWLNIPHLTVDSDDNYLAQLARLIAFGSDGVNPYTEPTPNPIYPPLRADLKVFVEYSNEIWAANNSFPQGKWAEDKASALGITQPRFNARMFSRCWEELEAVLGRARVVRVAAIFTANEGYTRPFIDEFYSHDLLKPDLIAPTTYFGNGIQLWAGNNLRRPATSPFSDPYWLDSPPLREDLAALFTQWKRYLLSESALNAESGRDATDASGGFPPYVREIAAARDLPIVAYEGGPSIYTDVNGVYLGDGITMLMEAINRDARISEVYRIHLEFARWHGLWSHTAFVDAGSWSRYGQWGHREFVGQPLAEAPKARVMLDWADEHQLIRHPRDAVGNVPQFTTDAALPFGFSGIPYEVPITTSGGDGPLTRKVIAALLPAGLSYNEQNGQVTGTPSTTSQETGWLFMRITDRDGDPAWQRFTVTVIHPGQPFSIEPVADVSMLTWDRTTPHFAESKCWLVRNSTFGDGAWTYFKFDLGEFSGVPIESARLTLDVIEFDSGNEAGPLPHRVLAYAISDAWDERTITFANAPQIGLTTSHPSPITALGPNTIDVTTLLKSSVSPSDRFFSFVLQNDPASYITTTFASKEVSDIAKRPRLSLVFDLPSPAPRIFDVRLQSNGQISFKVETASGVSIETSPDLVNWNPVRLVPASGGQAAFQDESTPTSGFRFYRAVQ